MLIQFTLSVEVEPLGRGDELSEKQTEALNTVLSNLEEVLGKVSLELDDSCWEEM